MSILTIGYQNQIHHHQAPFTIFVCFEFRELAKFWGDVWVHWLRPQHMEWFPHPYQTYKVFESIHMLYRVRWIYHHAPSTIFVCHGSIPLFEEVHKRIHIIRCDPSSCISMGGMDWYMASILVPRKTEDGGGGGGRKAPTRHIAEYMP